VGPLAATIRALLSPGECVSTNEFLDPQSTSATLYERARKVMPGGNTRTTVFSAPRPPYAASATGSTVTDVDGRERLDFVNNYTALIHGHAHPRIVDAVQRQLVLGSAFAFPTETEVTLAETLVDRVPSLEQVRFTNSGTEAVMLALQGARAFTGRTQIARFEGCYHGTYDFGELMLPQNQLDQAVALIERHASELAAVIVDPFPHNAGFLEPATGLLAGLREVTRQHGIVLISDEIISFRIGYRGAQGVFGFDPDLTTFGKIIGGGMPVGAYGGRRDLMEQIAPSGPIYQAGTLSGNPVAMAAGLAMLELIQAPGFHDQLAARTRLLADGFQSVADGEGVAFSTNRVGGMFGLFFSAEKVQTYAQATAADAALFNRFFHGMLKRGVYLAPSAFEAGFMSSAHSEQDIADTLEAARGALRDAKG
jgi:glutamate-1-semialdehyde 2,1-aminomutase